MVGFNLNFTDVRTAIKLIFQRYIVDDIDYEKLTEVAFNYHIEHSIRDEVCTGFKCFCNPRNEEYNDELKKIYTLFEIPTNFKYFIDSKYDNQDNVDEISTVDIHFENLRIEVEDMFDQCQSEICKSRQYINGFFPEIHHIENYETFITAMIRYIISIQTQLKSVDVNGHEYNNELTKIFTNPTDAKDFRNKLFQCDQSIMIHETGLNNRTCIMS
jgi:hypothetical protein